MFKLPCALVTALAVLGVVTIVPAAASADVNVEGCPEAPLSHPFAPWLDPAWYMEVPGGDFEGDSAGWSWQNASVVEGNETFHVNGEQDKRSLRLGRGGSAVSAPFCVFVEHPTVRFFARQVRGGGDDALVVDLRFADAGGKRHVLPIGIVAGGGAWAPGLPMAIQTALVANALNPATVRLGFHGTGGSVWEIDDVYEDPYRR
ncbi:MAG: hypothetical protein M3P50_04035 [Actinomycetota bacterium]|nr:hypothetical protein [Actinomycetota bacterium]